MTRAALLLNLAVLAGLVGCDDPVTPAPGASPEVVEAVTAPDPEPLPGEDTGDFAFRAEAIAQSSAARRAPSFDEPTSSMDPNSEMQLIERLKDEIADRTFILVSHRMNLLKLVDRVIVLDNGQMTHDGPRDRVLEAISKPQPPAGQPAR